MALRASHTRADAIAPLPFHALLYPRLTLTKPFPPPRVLTRSEIERVVECPALLDELEEGFKADSAARTVVPPLGHLALTDPPGDIHIKYGRILGEPYVVIKITAGIPENARHGLPTGTALLLAFASATGALEAVLLDEGCLTDLRTAGAGAIAAKYLAPKPVERIGIVGTGVQGRLQLELLANVTPCRDVVVTSGNPSASTFERRERARRYAVAMGAHGFRVEVAPDTRALAQACNLIVTATVSRAPLIDSAAVCPGTHITAVGADAPGKQELDTALVARANVIVADNVSQCLERGELAHARMAGVLRPSRVVELGAVLAGTAPGRTSADQITIADLTGIAVQDIVAATHVLRRLPTPS